MIAALNIFRAATRRVEMTPPPVPMFAVELVGTAACAASRGLTAFTDNPLEVAGALMRGRDPAQWDIRIRALAGTERPV